MGVTFSSDSSTSSPVNILASNKPDNPDSLGEEYHDQSLTNMTDIEARLLLRGPINQTKVLVEDFFRYQYSPIASFDEIKSLFMESTKVQHVELAIACWKIFGQRNNNCYLQEALLSLVLLADAPWTERLGLIFEIFHCRGTEEILSEDMRMILSMAAVALGRLWAEEVPHEQLAALCEHLVETALEQVL